MAWKHHLSIKFLSKKQTSLHLCKLRTMRSELPKFKGPVWMREKWAVRCSKTGGGERIRSRKFTLCSYLIAFLWGIVWRNCEVFSAHSEIAKKPSRGHTKKHNFLQCNYWILHPPSFLSSKHPTRVKRKIRFLHL